MNCAIYARVSTSEQIKGYSVDSQLEKCRDYATSQGWTIAAEYVDVYSATSDKRPEFQTMVRGAPGKFEAIIVSNFDRFARNMEHAVVYKSLLRRSGIQVVSVLEPIDQTSPLAVIQEGIIDLFAAFYSINLSVKIRQGQAKSIQAGRWPHKAPTGYTNKQGWVEVAEAGAGITLAFKEFATGRYTLETWTRAAYEMGITNNNARKIPMSHWSKIFNNRFYIGVISWSGEDIKGVHQPLVDQDVFDKVQFVLRNNERHVQHRVYRPYLLRGLLYSLDASSVMTGATGKTNSGQGYKYYRSRQPKPSGSRHSVAAELLENQVETILQGVVVNPQDLVKLENTLDDAILLALRVAPSLGTVYHWLKSDEQRLALLRVVISRYGLKVSGQEIVDVEPLPPFCFRFETGKVELRGVEPLTS